MGAFFMFIVLSPSSIYALDNCRLTTQSNLEKSKVKWVYDGDTLLVTDQKGKNERKIRIIGIDTPEVSHHQQKAQLYGAKAREALRALLKEHDYQIMLEFDKEKRDRYNRELAYTYLSNGESISEWLLKRGFAKTLIFPPNVKYANCYKKAERYAQKRNLKLWKLKRNRIKSLSDLKSKAKGYIRLKGTVSRIKQKKKSIILELKAKFKKAIQIKVKKKNLKYFKGIEFDDLKSKEVIITGILKNRKGRRTIHLNHSSQLDLVTIHDE